MLCRCLPHSHTYLSLLQEIEKKRELEEALSHRKRSSRLALRENEREEARLAAKKQQEEEEKFSRTRRLEARQQKEEEERIKRENAREQRRKEREAREESRRALTAYVCISYGIEHSLKFILFTVGRIWRRNKLPPKPKVLTKPRPTPVTLIAKLLQTGEMVNIMVVVVEADLGPLQERIGNYLVRSATVMESIWYVFSAVLLAECS